MLTTNDPVRLNFAEAVLKDAGIETHTLDANTAAVFGGALPWVKRRLLVREADGDRARKLLADALPKDDEA
ncbi:MAG: DUF2007 domain-containing protein [Oceanicaulis sp.]